MSQPPTRRPSRSGTSWRWADVIRSLIVLLAIIGAVAIYQAALTDDPADPVPTVDYTSALDAARADAGHPLLAPEQLPEGWRATSVRYQPGQEWAWHLGVLTSDDEYVGLEQAVAEADSLVEEAADGTEPVGTTQVDGAQWQLRRDESRGETTFVREAAGVTTLVTGSASQATLEDYIRSLRP
jgi:Protein of unknown function (DUF4245)